MTTNYSRTTGGPAASQSLLDQMTAQAAAAAVSAAAATASAVTASGYVTAVTSSATNAAASAVASQASAVSAAAQAAAAAVSAAAALAVFTTENTWTAGQTYNAGVFINGAGLLQLKPGSNDHTYMELYARTASPGTRSGYIGYPSTGSPNLNVINQEAAGYILLGTTGSVRWALDPSGHLSPQANNAYDLGSGARIRVAYVGTRVAVGQDSGGSVLHAYPGASDDSTYFSFYARSATPSTRSAFLGVGTTGSTAFQIMNEMTGGKVQLGTESVNRWEVSSAGHWLPVLNNAYDVGSASFAPRNLYAGTAYYQGSTKILGAQGAAVADATDAASAITQLNALLARCRAHGLIA